MSGRRRHSRLRVTLDARLITLDGTFSATLMDISISGAKVALERMASPGGNAVLTWADYEAFCTITWSGGGHWGLEFEELLSPHVLLDTRDLADAKARLDANRRPSRDWASGPGSFRR